MVVEYLSVFFVIVCCDSKVIEGLIVSINYVLGLFKWIEKMELFKWSLVEGFNVVIVDDFMKVGGIINGMKNLLEEFNVYLVGIGVLVEFEYVEECLVDDYVFFVKIKNVNMKEK